MGSYRRSRARRVYKRTQKAHFCGPQKRHIVTYSCPNALPRPQKDPPLEGLRFWAYGIDPTTQFKTRPSGAIIQQFGILIFLIENNIVKNQI